MIFFLIFMEIKGSCSSQAVKLGKLFFLSNFLSGSEYLVWDQCGTIHVRRVLSCLFTYLSTCRKQYTKHCKLQLQLPPREAAVSGRKAELSPPSLQAGLCRSLLPAVWLLTVAVFTLVSQSGSLGTEILTIHQDHRTPTPTTRTSTKPVETNTWLLWNILFDTEGHSGC